MAFAMFPPKLDPPPLVFLDTCIYKAAARVTVFGKKVHHYNQDGEYKGWHIPIVDYNYNEDVPDDRHRKELEHVASIARLFVHGVLRAADSPEVRLEFLSLPKSGGGPSLLREVEREQLMPPVPWPMHLRLSHWREDLSAHLKVIRDPRFHEIKKMVGAYQGDKPAPFNQLLDALYLWTAERGGCQYFLTVDHKLRRFSFRSDTLQIVLPSELLERFPLEPDSVG